MEQIKFWPKFKRKITYLQNLIIKKKINQILIFFIHIAKKHKQKNLIRHKMTPKESC